MDEASFWSNRVRPIVSPIGMFKRVENGLDSGTPDVYFCVDGFSGWIENKYREEPPVRDTTVVFGSQRGLRQEQIVWWTEHLIYNGAGLLIWGVGRQSFYAPVTRGLLKAFNRMTWGEMGSLFGSAHPFDLRIREYFRR